MKTTTSIAIHNSQLSDETLISLILSGQEEARTILIRRYEKLLRFVLQRYLSDPEAVQEVMHDTFIRAFRALPGFRGDCKFSTWLSRIAISQAISRLRSKRYAAWAPIDNLLSHWEDDLHNNETALEKQEASDLLRRAVQQLNPNDATALELFYFREQSIEEIGQITGWTTTNIKSRLSRARQRLRSVLGNKHKYMEQYA